MQSSGARWCLAGRVRFLALSPNLIYSFISDEGAALPSSKKSRASKSRRPKSWRAMPSRRAPGGFRDSNAATQNGRSTLSERLYQGLKRDIIRGIYPPGEALGEKDLARRYKSSRTPVREAAVRLQQENLLRIVPNRGYFASSMTINWLNEIYEFRAAVDRKSVV